MNGLKLLIDTNILIGLEDNKEITEVFSSLHQKCHQINKKDGIFASLRADYAEFGTWFQKSCVRSHT